MNSKTEHKVIKARAIIISLLFALISFASFAQQSQLLRDSSTGSVDTLVNLKKYVLDQTSINKKTDSLSKAIIGRTDSLGRLSKSVTQRFDSLRPDYKKYTHGLDSIKKNLTHKVDSLKKLGIPTQRYTKALDSLNKLNPTKEFQKLQNKLNEQQTKVAQGMNKPISQVDQKINSLTKAAGLPSGINLPNVPQVNSALSSLSQGVKIPNANQLNVSGLSSTNLNQLSQVEAPLTQNINSIQKDLSKDLDPNIQNDIEKDFNSVTNSSDLKGVQQASGTVTNDVSKYSKQANALQNEDNLEKDITSQLSSNELSGLQKEVQQINQQETELKNLKNKEEFKKQTLARAKKIIAAQWAVQQKQMQPLVTKVNQYEKNSNNLIRQTKGLPKQRPPRESMPTFIERFVPALTWQIQKNNIWRIDFNPSVRFRVRKLLSIGGGWNERIAIDQKGNFKWDERVYGIRNFVEVTIRKGISLRLDAEYMNAFVPISYQQQDIGNRKWVWCYLGGLKKEFSFGHGIVGNTQVMYLLSNQQNSPYLNKLNVRLGIELPIKVKKKT